MSTAPASSTFAPTVGQAPPSAPNPPQPISSAGGGPGTSRLASSTLALYDDVTLSSNKFGWLVARCKEAGFEVEHCDTADDVRQVLSGLHRDNASSLAAVWRDGKHPMQQQQQRFQATCYEIEKLSTLLQTKIRELEKKEIFKPLTPPASAPNTPLQKPTVTPVQGFVPSASAIPASPAAGSIPSSDRRGATSSSPSVSSTLRGLSSVPPPEDMLPEPVVGVDSDSANTSASASAADVRALLSSILSTPQVLSTWDARMRETTANVPPSLAEQPNGVYVLFLGDTSAGKSTLINSILGDDTLPMGHGHTTAAATHVIHPKASNGTVRLTLLPTSASSGEPQKEYIIDSSANIAEQLRPHVTQLRERSEGLAYRGAIIEYPCPLLSLGLRLVDFPGSGDIHGEMEELTQTLVAGAAASPGESPVALADSPPPARAAVSEPALVDSTAVLTTPTKSDTQPAAALGALANPGGASYAGLASVAAPKNSSASSSTTAPGIAALPDTQCASLLQLFIRSCSTIVCVIKQVISPSLRSVLQCIDELHGLHFDFNRMFFVATHMFEGKEYNEQQKESALNDLYHSLDLCTRGRWNRQQFMVFNAQQSFQSISHFGVYNREYHALMRHLTPFLARSYNHLLFEYYNQVMTCTETLYVYLQEVKRKMSHAKLASKVSATKKLLDRFHARMAALRQSMTSSVQRREALLHNRLVGYTNSDEFEKDLSEYAALAKLFHQNRNDSERIGASRVLMYRVSSLLSGRVERSILEFVQEIARDTASAIRVVREEEPDAFAEFWADPVAASIPLQPGVMSDAAPSSANAPSGGQSALPTSSAASAGSGVSPQALPVGSSSSGLVDYPGVWDIEPWAAFRRIPDLYDIYDRQRFSPSSAGETVSDVRSLHTDMYEFPATFSTTMSAISRIVEEEGLSPSLCRVIVSEAALAASRNLSAFRSSDLFGTMSNGTLVTRTWLRLFSGRTLEIHNVVNHVRSPDFSNHLRSHIMAVCRRLDRLASAVLVSVHATFRARDALRKYASEMQLSIEQSDVCANISRDIKSKIAAPLSKLAWLRIQQWPIPAERLAKLEVLGNGTTASVFSSILSLSPQLAESMGINELPTGAGNASDTADIEVRVAVKMLKPELRNDHIEMVHNEVMQHSRMKHPNVIKLYGACVPENGGAASAASSTGGLFLDRVCLIMEYADGGTLEDWLAKQVSKEDTSLSPSSLDRLTVHRAAKAAQQVALGMRYVAGLQILHRDLTCNNILVCNENHTDGPTMKVADLGNAKHVAQATNTPNITTPLYAAPETMQKTKVSCGTEIDVYSFAYVLYRLLHPRETLMSAWSKLTHRPGSSLRLSELRKLVHANKRPAIADYVPLPIQALVNSCWDGDPTKRPTWDHIIQQLQPFAADINYAPPNQLPRAPSFVFDSKELLAERKAHGLRVLVIDGGGTRGIIPAMLLRELLCRLQRASGSSISVPPRVHHYFDLVVGTSTGGIIALAASAVELTPEEMVQLYKRLGKEIFAKGRTAAGTIVKKGWRFMRQGQLYSAKTLEDILQQTFSASNKPLMLNSCRLKTAVVTRRNNADGAFLLRSYKHGDLKQPSYSTPAFPAPEEFPVWKAARATSAAPFFFAPLEDNTSGPSCVYRDGGVGFNNAAELALDEAQALTGLSVHSAVRYMVSLGTGEVSTGLNSETGMAAAVELLKEQATSSYDTHKRMLKRISAHCLEHMPSRRAQKAPVVCTCVTYRRFNPHLPVSISLDASSEAELKQMETITDSYLREKARAEEMDALVKEMLS